MQKMETFFEALNYYQSNSYASESRKSFLVNSFNELTEKEKELICAKRVGKLYRGADSFNNDEICASFSENERYAKGFGYFYKSNKDLFSFKYIISTRKCRALSIKLKSQFEIGDDEGEFIYILPKYS